ncbi:urea carboxylase [Halothiobacillus diazotrophicus]|uniref:Biotin carboxylase n=1 Tax=Halothiobacillus diazotrophicus TaxID=1860122 RepID=A0A191ZDQ2_9GAMM|nr:urea carboxylase [Halothiobacillus diazotrophicus]ANJ65996.1 urea carboxylase [Halothiobacillus diazotrophicus]
MFKKVLIANRGEIAVRIARTLKTMGVTSVAVYSDSDQDSPHVRACDEAIALGGQTAAESYLQAERILQLAKDHGVEAIIPGYGFLSENASFAELCAAAGIAFVGPTPEQLREFGLKHRARELAEAASVPLAPGSALLKDRHSALTEAERIGYPIMLKSTAGGGGIGLRRCADADALSEAFEAVAGMGSRFFGDGGVFVERFIDQARHIEIQIFGDGQGRVVALGERDCSLQRRNQKVIEETPAPNLPQATREAMAAAAVRLGESIRYQSAGTVEYIYDAARDEFYFLEVNTRLQVEHPVTEMVTGVDLIEWMVRLAAGDPVDMTVPAPNGVAIEGRIYAEEPLRNFQPSPGKLSNVTLPGGDGIRVDTWVETSTVVPAQFDPMLAKIICHGATRTEALARMAEALDVARFDGISTNRMLLRALVEQPDFVAARHGTATIDHYLGANGFTPRAIEVIKPGTYTLIQDYPGRLGLWHIGVPPSGPMDDYAFRIANRIVGNDAGAAALECTLVGPTLRFHHPVLVAVTGAPAPILLDDQPVEAWRPIQVAAGQTLSIGQATAGSRIYLAIRGGIDVPQYLGSRSTFALGAFGGHAGRTLAPGDILPFGGDEPSVAAGGNALPAPIHAPKVADERLIPTYPDVWEIGVLYGPHGAPDFFTDDAIEQFFSIEWQVHYNSNRLGIRLQGPKLSWARSDGGEAGLHPSNIHDTEYAVGSVNFTGDMPVILTRDGPSLGGFVCPATIIRSELWKVGQLKPGDRIRFVPISYDAARVREELQDQHIESLEVPTPAPDLLAERGECVLMDQPAKGEDPRLAIRQAGDGYVLLEYGENVLDLVLRLRVHALMEQLETDPIPGVLECSPGVRSLQIRYEPKRIAQSTLVARLTALNEHLPDIRTLAVPSRILHLPMAFEDSATLDAVARYRQSVRDTAPWLPRNSEFIRRINGLPDIQTVEDTVFAASYLVLGLGDVYLGAPCAVPLDPRHRLLTSKYNPARTYTAEGTVGIGGVYMCIYGMDSPGGYQLVGRTLPIWNRRPAHPTFAPDQPWLLRFFDQVRFYRVDEPELLRLRHAFSIGQFLPEITETVFRLDEHEAFLAEHAESIAEFRSRQAIAYETEVSLWQEEDGSLATRESASSDTEATGEPIPSTISGNVWKLLVEPGEAVQAGQPVAIIEAMKMEFTIEAPREGIIAQCCCAPGQLVQMGQTLITLEESA